MPRQINLQAEFNFEIDDHDEYTLMRNRVLNFASNNNGEASFRAYETSDGIDLYTCKVDMSFAVVSRAAAASLMNTIDNNLNILPDTYTTNGFQIRYNMTEIEP